MKKLSIEQKAKAYDEAFRIAQELYNDHNSSNVGKGYVCTVFPELYESKDEKIRKELINCFIKGKEYLSLCSFSKDEILAWLEKQGEQKPIDKVEHKFEIGDWVVFNNKHQSIYQVEKIEDGYYILRHTHGGTFRVCVLHNKSLRHWTIQDAKDGDVLYLQHDGKEHIIIYKGVIKERFRTFISAYCAYNSIVDAFCFADVSRYIDIAYGGITPATKEQRDLLFQKMKEAGYEWDAEKKELKKIKLNEREKSVEWSKEVVNWWKPSKEQIIALRWVLNNIPYNRHKEEISELLDQIKELKKIENEIEIPFGANDSELQEASYHIPKGFHAEVERNKVIIKRGEQKSTEWSEDDEVMLRTAQKVIFESDDCSDGTTSKLIDWLKSIKDRVQT